MPEKVLIWGIGWLGLPLARNIQSIGYQICCITRNIEKKESLIGSSLEALTIDDLLASPNYLSDCDVFILTVPPSEDSNFLEQLSLVLKYLPDKTQVVYTSSTGIYKNSNGFVDENSMTDSSSSIFSIEELLQNNRKQNLVILRLGGLIGPERHPIHFLAKKSVNENPNQAVNLIQQSDVIEIVMLFIESKKSGIFNLCSNEHPSRKDYYSHSAKVWGYKPLVFSEGNKDIGKIVQTNKFVAYFPKFNFTSIYEFQYCK